MSLLSVLLIALVACLQFSIQREKLEDRLDSLAEQHLSAAANLATSHKEVESLRMQVESFKSQLPHSAQAAVYHPKAHLAEMTGQLLESQSTADNLKQQLQGATLQLQHVQSKADESARREAAEAVAASDFKGQLQDARAALQHAHSRFAAEAAGHEASWAAVASQLQDHQSIIMILLAAWAILMAAHNIAWEQPVDEDIQHFEHCLLQAQQQALTSLEELRCHARGSQVSNS